MKDYGERELMKQQKLTQLIIIETKKIVCPNMTGSNSNSNSNNKKSYKNGWQHSE